MSHPTPKVDFKAIADEEIKKIAPSFVEYDWENKDAYVDFISNMYYFLAKACRLLTAAASHCDEKYDIFHHRFVEHAGEEKNHEKLVLHDLKAMGETLRPELPSMKPVWQTQFYLIQNKSPLSLFGCIAYLENLSLEAKIGPQVYERCQKAYGTKATTYLRVHVNEDHDHVVKLFTALGQLPPHEIENVKESLLITSTLFKNFFTELCANHAAHSRAA